MKLFREENVQMLHEAISGDEYDDLAQANNETGAQFGGLPQVAINYIHQIVEGQFGTLEDLQPLIDSGKFKGLECGIGSWAYKGNPFITHAIEPSLVMLERLKERTCANLQPNNIVEGVVECLPDEWVNQFNLVLFTNGFFQVRSDYEALIEINRVLKIGGIFLFNLYGNDDQDIICGRVLGVKNYLRVVREFGFELMSWLPNVDQKNAGKGIHYIAMVKTRPFDFRALRKLQLVPNGEGHYKANNLIPDGRDFSIL